MSSGCLVSLVSDGDVPVSIKPELCSLETSDSSNNHI